MYLKIDEFNHLDDIPDYYNFQKPYLIRGGCRSMKIFNREDKMQFFFTTPTRYQTGHRNL